MKHNSLMKRLLVVSLCLLALVCLGSAQQSSGDQASPATAAAAPGPDRGPIEATLKAYVSAYERRSMDELLAVWPDLQGQKKEFKKIKDHFNDGSVLEPVKVTLGPQEIQSSKDDAIARCQRTEEYVKLETHTDSAGDAMMSNVAQRPPPTQSTNKKNVKKTETLWFKLHKNGDKWQVVAVSDKQLSM